MEESWSLTPNLKKKKALNIKIHFDFEGAYNVNTMVIESRKYKFPMQEPWHVPDIYNIILSVVGKLDCLPDLRTAVLQFPAVRFDLRSAVRFDLRTAVLQFPAVRFERIGDALK